MNGEKESFQNRLRAKQTAQVTNKELRINGKCNHLPLLFLSRLISFILIVSFLLKFQEPKIYERKQP